jgi:hypothetical protein
LGFIHDDKKNLTLSEEQICSSFMRTFVLPRGFSGTFAARCFICSTTLLKSGFTVIMKKTFFELDDKKSGRNSCC